MYKVLLLTTIVCLSWIFEATCVGQVVNNFSFSKKNERRHFQVSLPMYHLMSRLEAKKYQKSTKAFVRTCDQDRNADMAHFPDHSLLASQCPKGLIFKESFRPSCLCLKGVWILHRKICDDSPILLIGRQNATMDCYTVNFNISSMLFLGNVNSSFDPKAFVSPRTMTVFHEIPANGSWTPILNFDSPLIIIIAINPPIDIGYEAEGSSDCFSQKKDPQMTTHYGDEVKVHIWFITTTLHSSTRYRQVKQFGGCKFGMASYEEIATHNSFYFHSSKTVPLPVEGCDRKCDLIMDYNGIPIVGHLPGSTGHGHVGSEHVLRLPYQKWLDFFEREERGEAIDYKLLKKKEREKIKILNHFITMDLARLNKEGMEGSSLLRSKRQVVDCDLTWDGMAICLKNYWEVINHIEMNEDDEKLCYPSPPLYNN